MKKIILSMGLLVTMGLATAFADDGHGINSAVSSSFDRDFASAKNVNWERQKDFIKATFNMNDLVMYAYYQPDGELLAVSRNLLSNQLPIFLRGDLKKNYGSYWISDLFELASNDQSNYYIRVENADENLVLKSDGYNGWTIYKREKKTSI
jgi:hypothetical protein